MDKLLELIKTKIDEGIVNIKEDYIVDDNIMYNADYELNEIQDDIWRDILDYIEEELRK